MSLFLIDRRLLALTLCLFCVSCVARGSYDPSGGQAIQVVKAVEAGIARGDYGPAHAAYDYRYRLDELLGDIWRHGTRAEQDELVAMSQGLFEDTTRKYWATCCGDQRMTTTVSKVDGEHVWVSSRAPRQPDSKQGFEWSYRLTKRGDTWAITQREFQDTRGQRSGSSRFWPMAVGKITQAYGRTPTLGELTANLPSLQGKLRARTFTFNPPGQRQNQ